MSNNEAIKIFNSQQVRDIDAYTITHEPIRSIDLMERAAGALSDYLLNELDLLHSIKVFAGPGNNGGDGLAVARMLSDADFKVSVYIADFTEKKSPNLLTNYERLVNKGDTTIYKLKSEKDFPSVGRQDIVIDALFGSGLSKPLSGAFATLVKHINSSGAKVIAIDIPSGLFTEDNSTNNTSHIIHADTTLSLHFAKLAFMFAENYKYVGDWHIIPIGLHPGAIEKEETSNFLISTEHLKSIKHKRDKFSHKGNYGHSLLISGCHGRMGAAVLASRAALRAGTGLLTTHVPVKGINILQTAVPEAMLSIDQSDIIFSEAPGLSEYSAVGIGPALGSRANSKKGMLGLLRNAKKANKPMVIDADGINILAGDKDLLKEIPENSILTPHPKEFERLVGKCNNGHERYMKQIEFAMTNKLVIVLKGACSSVACPDGRCLFNTSGNPGMATAGSGDVLTGIILGLLSQGYQAEQAAQLGVYLHGLAGDLAETKLGREALIASDIIDFLPKAFKEID